MNLYPLATNLCHNFFTPTKEQCCRWLVWNLGEESEKKGMGSIWLHEIPGFMGMHSRMQVLIYFKKAIYLKNKGGIYSISHLLRSLHLTLLWCSVSDSPSSVRQAAELPGWILFPHQQTPSPQHQQIWKLLLKLKKQRKFA